MDILVMEDDAELAGFISRGLRELGHSVRVAAGGHAGLDLLLGTSFDVAVLDRMVPGLDGLAVLREARRAGCQTPILLLTALAGVDDRGALASLYDAIVAAARQPTWYREGSVPDTIDGRFDMVTAMLSLVLIRLEAEGEGERGIGAADCSSTTWTGNCARTGSATWSSASMSAG